MKQTIFSILLMLLPLMAWADDSGSCGDGVTYSYVEATHTLTISKTGVGTGTMNDYMWGEDKPWESYINEILYVVIQTGVTSIGIGDFRNCNYLKSITIPNSVTSIGDAAFQFCNKLSSLTIPEGVLTINDYTFYECGSLLSVTIPNSVTSIGNYVFYGCSGLTTITIPNSVTSIGEYAFSSCGSLTTITIPNGVTSISYSAFSGCSGLTSITIPNSVTSIGGSAFSSCSGLTSITIPNSVTSIGGSAFQWCSGLASITIPNSVTSIGGSAFYGCIGLASITIPNSVTSIGEWAFTNCSGLTSITIPSSVTSIGNSTFYGCSGLTSITIPNSVTSIGNIAFYGCIGLTSITIPNSVMTIGESAFKDCSSMETLKLPDQLQIIKKETFYGCSSLESVTIPASVEFIYQEAFAGCRSLEEINALPTTPPLIYNKTFSDYTIPLNVPSGCAAAYQNADNWSNFTTINDGNVYYNLSITAGANGTVTYGGTAVTSKTETFSVKEGTNATLTFTPAAGYALTGLTVNGVDKLADVSGGSLTISNVTANTTVVATFNYAGATATVTISSVGQGTYCYNQDLDFTDVDGIKAYVASGFNPIDGNILLMRVKEVPAGTGLLVKGNAGTYTIPVKDTHFYYLNMFKPVFAATTVATEEGDNTNYVLANGSEGLKFYKSSGASLAANRAYLQIPTSVLGNHSNARSIGYTFDDEEGTTAINSINEDTDEGVLYNLNGQRVTTPRKGIYVRNGKKVFVNK